MRTFISFLLFLAVMCATSCAGDDPAHELGDGVQTQLDTAGDRDLSVMLPFPAGESRVLTRTYQTSPTHLRHGDKEWDDAYALDFAGDGCGSTWGTPVLAAAAGTVVDYPLPGSKAVRTNLESSYGPNQVFIDHGNGCYSHYGHLSARTVAPGQRVQQGEKIGAVGNEGNVETSCRQNPKTDGAHLHFKLFCGGSAIVPEPLSGYSGLGSATGMRLSHKALHHPVGTLVKTASSPDIFAVCAEDRLCRVRDETVWRSYRFWQDQSKEWATVVNVSADELACHDRGLDLDRTVQLAATTCLDGGAWPTFVTYDDGVTKWRRRVPFAPTDPEYAILLRSWGFRPSDVLTNGRTCAIPKSVDERLPLRDGSVIEQASDGDFYVVTDDGMARRLYRNLMPVLYGNGWPQVIQVPDGSVPSLVRGMDHAHAEFTVTDATTCPNGSRRLVPAKGDGKGGGDAPAVQDPSESSPEVPGPSDTPVPSCAETCVLNAHRCIDGAPNICVPVSADCNRWSAGECNDGFACSDASGQCERVTDAPRTPDPPVTATEPATDPPATDPPTTTPTPVFVEPALTCLANASGLRITLSGLSVDALVDAAGVSSGNLSFLAAGGDGNLSWTPTASSLPQVPLASEQVSGAGGTAGEITLTLPAGVARFNLWAWSSTQKRAYWLDLTRWSATGDCRIADDGLGGKVLLR